MIDGRPVVDVHLHAARRDTLKIKWEMWTQAGDPKVVEALYDEDGTVNPRRFSAFLAKEGVDMGLVLAEYSPKVTGMQVAEDMVPLVAGGGGRVGLIAAVNPHLHYPIEEELERQVAMGAVACKLHPVHAGFYVNDRELYPVYEFCQSAGIPVVIHCGTSNFPGAANKYADPVHLDDVLRDFRHLDFALAHGGRGWWYDAAAFMALANPRVWIELSGLPPSRLKTYYAKHNWQRLCRKMIFGTDWPAIPGIAHNARKVIELCPDEETADLVMAGNAERVYNLKIDSGGRRASK